MTVNKTSKETTQKPINLPKAPTKSLKAPTKLVQSAQKSQKQKSLTVKQILDSKKQKLQKPQQKDLKVEKTLNLKPKEVEKKNLKIEEVKNPHKEKLSNLEAELKIIKMEQRNLENQKARNQSEVDQNKKDKEVLQKEANAIKVKIYEVRKESMLQKKSNNPQLDLKIKEVKNPIKPQTVNEIGRGKEVPQKFQQSSKLQQPKIVAKVEQSKEEMPQERKY